MLTHLDAWEITEKSDVSLNKLLNYITETADKMYERSGRKLNSMLELITKLNYDAWRKFILTQEHADFLLDNLSTEEVSFWQVRFRWWSVIEQKSPNYPAVSTGLQCWKQYIHEELLAAAQEIGNQKRANELSTDEVEIHPERIFALPKERAFLVTLSPDFFVNIIGWQPVATKEVLIGPNIFEEWTTTSNIYTTFDSQHNIVKDLYNLHQVLVNKDFFNMRVFTVPADRTSLLDYNRSKNNF